jgi:hypothetical protein
MNDQTPPKCVTNNQDNLGQNVTRAPNSIRHTALTTLSSAFTSGFSTLASAVVQIADNEAEEALEIDGTTTGDSLKTLLQQLQGHV